jgi:hypothetical protein
VRTFVLFALVVIFPFISQAQEEICGEVKASSVEGKLSVWLENRTWYAGRQVNFTVLNSSEIDWITGHCLCVTGEYEIDPSEDSEYYQLITVSQVTASTLNMERCRPARPQ